MTNELTMWGAPSELGQIIIFNFHFRFKNDPFALTEWNTIVDIWIYIVQVLFLTHCKNAQLLDNVDIQPNLYLYTHSESIFLQIKSPISSLR